jgi:hypothetical protein
MEAGIGEVAGATSSWLVVQKGGAQATAAAMTLVLLERQYAAVQAMPQGGYSDG